MDIVRPDLLIFSRACEALLSAAREPELSQDEKNFLLYYAAELVKRYGQPLKSHSDHPQLPLPITTARPSEQSSSPTSPQMQ